MIKPIKEMTNGELINAFSKGKAWVANREQVTGTNKNKLGTAYDHEDFMAGLKRIEALEDEMKERNINYA
jgi:hypothetical protein